MDRKWTRWVAIGVGVLGDTRAVRRDLKCHPGRLLTGRDRLLGEERGEARELRYTAARRRESGDPVAVASYERLVELRTAAWGADHPLVLDTRLLLAQVRTEAGDATGAADAYGLLLPGEDPARAAWARRNRAYWREREGWVPPVLRWDELEGRLPEAVVVRKEPPDVAALWHLAQVRRHQGDEAGAVEAYERLLRERTRLRGADHHVVLLTRLTLAGLRARAGDAAGALDAYERLSADMERVLGPRHRGTRWTRRQRDRWRGSVG
ncbi:MULTISPECIES: tetratricopeptide repeat protein [unclassified Streptomyces]|uniref:tetratricopeptide repeat protein n=1 Tax=unclassified Streptomyces TaxID=2593676 RepID=UPI000DABCF99|nr:MULTISPECIES: tetratricopeptide repeat protein [unclassified Streptomyces]PZT74303.1 hypothetical protein DNK55_19460 [Streptomyces sp. AC1-42T]PZT82707.1 hypothetical protein DNK56_11980 [Streptomyces sp. AC1-42W]